MYIFNFNWISESFKKHSHGVHELPVKQFHSFLTWIGRIFFIVTSDYGSIIVAMEMKRSLGWQASLAPHTQRLLAPVHLTVHRAHSSQSVGIRNSGTTCGLVELLGIRWLRTPSLLSRNLGMSNGAARESHFSLRKALPTPQYSVQEVMNISSQTWKHPSHVAEQTEFEKRRCLSEGNRCGLLPLPGHCSWVDKNTRKQGWGVNFILLHFNLNSWLLS